ncbi:MAG: hypothetical protein R2932_35005 [Caldilineaceae bacterium]
MSRAMAPRLLFFATIALLMFAELWFSNLGSYRNNLEGTAALMGLTVVAERNRLVILIVLDAIAGGGALVAGIACLFNHIVLRRIGTMLTTIGLVSYGIYQLIAAVTQLPLELRSTIALIGLIYIGIGCVAWIVGMRPTPDTHPAQ